MDKQNVSENKPIVIQCCTTLYGSLSRHILIVIRGHLVTMEIMELDIDQATTLKQANELLFADTLMFCYAADDMNSVEILRKVKQ